MLPNYKAWDVLEKLSDRKFKSPYKQDLIGLVTVMRARVARYNRYEDELDKLEQEKESMTEKDYDLQKIKYKVGMKETKKLIDKSDKDICSYARKAHILEEDDDINDEGKETQRKRKAGRGRFRLRTSATDIGVDMGTDRMIRNMKRMSFGLNKKFK